MVGKDADYGRLLQFYLPHKIYRYLYIIIYHPVLFIKRNYLSISGFYLFYQRRTF